MSKKKILGKGLTILLVFIMLFVMAGPNLLAAQVVTNPGNAPFPGNEKIEVLIGFHGPPNRGLVQAFGGEVYAEFTIVDVIAAQMTPRAAEALGRNPAVRYIEPDSPVYAIGQTVPWGINRVFGDEAFPFYTWDSSTGDGIEVAILDTGIEITHVDLDVVDGINTIDNTHWGADGHGHGTHVAGTVAALNNELGVVGVAPKVSLYAVKVLNDSGSGTVSSIAKGIEWSVEQAIPVMNMSLGTSSDSITLREACDTAYSAGHLLVAAAGNSGNVPGRGDNVIYPAKYDSVIAVAASASNDRRASFSSTGPAVELIAPGAGIYSTWKGNSYREASGTSMASPHVAGVAALVWAAETTLTNGEVRAILRQTAENLGLSADHQGYGLVRADLAVAAVSTPEDPVTPSTYTVSGTVRDGNQEPLEGAVVAIGGTGLSVTTGSDGAYSFSDVEEDTYNITASKDGYSSETKAVEVNEDTTADFVLVKTPEATGGVTVSSIDYSTSGGKTQDRHLHVTVALKDGHEVPVSGAKVEIVLYWGDSPYATSAGTINGDGTVTFSYNNAPSGLYTTTVTGVTAEGLVWDGISPENSYEKP